MLYYICYILISQREFQSRCTYTDSDSLNPRTRRYFMRTIENAAATRYKDFLYRLKVYYYSIWTCEKTNGKNEPNFIHRYTYRCTYIIILSTIGTSVYEMRAQLLHCTSRRAKLVAMVVVNE